MAPTAPKKRPSMRSKTPKSTSASSIAKAGSGLISREPSLSSSTKKDKRIIKSNIFKSRIEKSHAKSLKRRRPNKKLATTLDSLADALPNLEDVSQGKGRKAEKGKIKMDSLTSGKGLMKRRGKVEAVERERFGRNLAQLMGSQTQSGGNANAKAGEMHVEAEGAKAPSNSTTSRFKALRAWIGQTMEKDGAFEEKTE